MREVEISVHCHDDLGLAVANSYAGLLAGARQVECAVNGIGERAGNCSLEEIVMLLRTRARRATGLDTGIDARELARTSRLVSRLTGYSVPPNKAVVGRNAFAHESGIHQDGVLKERIDLRDHGRDRGRAWSRTPSCWASTPGRHALQDALQQLGFKVEGGRAEPGVQALQGDRGQEEAGHRARPGGDRLRRRCASRRDAYELRLVRDRGRLAARPQARVSVVLPSGEESVARASGDGPGGRDLRRDPRGDGHRAPSSSATRSRRSPGGTDALGQVTASPSAPTARLASGQGVATDILEASARAFVRAISNALEGVAIREAEDATADAAVERTRLGP